MSLEEYICEKPELRTPRLTLRTLRLADAFPRPADPAKRRKYEMDMRTVEKNSKKCAVISGGAEVITDAQSALDMLICASYEAGTKNIVISKKLVREDFFVLSSGLAGEILQKLINYGGRIAIFGDYSRYTSKPLKDFIYESNKGKDVFFVATEEDAVDCLLR